MFFLVSFNFASYVRHDIFQSCEALRDPLSEILCGATLYLLEVQACHNVLELAFTGIQNGRDHFLHLEEAHSLKDRMMHLRLGRASILDTIHEIVSKVGEDVWVVLHIFQPLVKNRDVFCLVLVILKHLWTVLDKDV